MPIKERWSRMLRKSISSGSSGGGQTDVSSSPTEGETLSKPPSRLAKTLTWRSSASSKPPKPKKPSPPKQKKGLRHPSERELTETNLKHQELLSTFTMKFGRRKSSAGRTSYTGVSPGNSRQASLDAGYGHHHGHHGLGPDRRISSLAHEAPPREDQEESS